jgi:hypothetical protein
MKKNDLRALCLSVLCTLVSSAYANVAGQYNVKGKDFAGQAYEGKLTISSVGPVYRLSYRDGRTERGMGILRGDTLFAAWGPSKRCSVSALEIKDGYLEGPWGDLDRNALGSETLTRNSGSGVVGVYSVSGKDPEGVDYAGTTTIDQRGDVFKVSFSGDGQTWEGVAIRLGNHLAVSYGGPKCRVTAYRLDSQTNTLSGHYAEYGESRLGSEKMTKGW